jgi:hypothetical protein
MENNMVLPFDYRLNYICGRARFMTLESKDCRFEIFKRACKYMDEGKWWEAEKMFKSLASFCWIMFLKEERRWI